MTSEINMPVFKQLTVNLSGRYDDYQVAGGSVSHGTYNLGLEYRPLDTLLLRGKYGTAFKAPTLADEFQGLSGYYSSVTDYTNCARLGYTGANIGACPDKYANAQFFGQQSGNTKLKPITAKNWNYGVVWAPIRNMSINADYYHFDLSNEVAQQSADLLSQQEYLCRTGALDIHSPSCVQALAQIVRLPQTSGQFLGDIDTIYTPKVNTAKERLNVLIAGFAFRWGIGAYGRLDFNASYTNILKHEAQEYPNDPVIDLLRNPYYSTDFKTKANASVTWSVGRWSSTLFVNRFGSTPNYLASVLNNYTDPGMGKLAPWILYNASVGYKPIEKLSLSLSINNLFNSMPPHDHSYPGTAGSPYNDQNYNVYGRAYYLQATYRFGALKQP